MGCFSYFGIRLTVCGNYMPGTDALHVKYELLALARNGNVGEISGQGLE
jgi:hypothetical protein